MPGWKIVGRWAERSNVASLNGRRDFQRHFLSRDHVLRFPGTAAPVGGVLAGPNNHDLSNRAGATLLILSRSFVLLISQHVVPPVLCVPRQSVDKAELLLLSRLATIYAAGTTLV